MKFSQKENFKILSNAPFKMSECYFDGTMGLTTQEGGSRSMRILSGLPKSRLCLNGKLQISDICICAVCCVWKRNTNAMWLLPRIKARVRTCAYMHVHANCCFQIYSTPSYLRSVENDTQIQIRSGLGKST